MENIPLRIYNREIEQLIASDQSQDALKHCQHILDIYPRCLETFRLIGQAYLELNQFELAEETFQKVLQSIPDDFTANLGMSLLCEKQDDINGTIFHMERAYEAQPNNTAVQTELRRLNQQRDGIKTSRLRLTRGALVRMYIRGDLFPQALNEIQAILEEDPTRMDIRILQSVVLLKSGKADEALQNCRQILVEMPYCYEANKMLFENSSSSTRIEDIQIYQQHLRELDPYYEFTSKANPDPLKVSEDEVKISVPEEMKLQKAGIVSETPPALPAFESFSNATPEDMGKTGIDNLNFESPDSIPQKEDKPAWLDGIEIASFNEETIIAQKELSSEPSYTPKKEIELSEPMTTEGTTPYNEFPNGKDEESEQPYEDSLPANPFLTSAGSQIPVAEPGDIPEWLRALASEPPAASSDAITAPLRVPGETGVLQTGEENLDFLRNIPGEPQSVSNDSSALPERKLNLAAESLPTILPSDPFLVTSETTQPIPIETPAAKQETPALNVNVPDWIKNVDEKPVALSAKEEFIQEFMSDSPQTQENPASFSVNDFEDSKEQQNQAPQQQIPQTQTEADVPTPEIEQYLEQLRKDISPGEQPEWLHKDNLGSEIEALFSDDKKSSIQTPTSDPTLDWMNETKKEELEPPQVSENKTPISVPNVPDWLFTPETGEEDTAPIELDNPVTKQPPPDWLKDVKPEVLGLTENYEPFDVNQNKIDGKEDQVPDLSFLDSKTFDFQQADRDLFVDNLNDTNAPTNEGLPADLAALLRDDADKEIHTNPLPDEEPVSQSFTPSDFFTDLEFQTEKPAEEAESQIPNLLEEIPSSLESETAFQSKVDEQVPQEDPLKYKETGPVFSIEEIQPYLNDQTPVEEASEVKPVAQFIDEEPTITQGIPEDEPVGQFIPEEQPVAQFIPDEQPAVQIIPEEQPVAQVIPEKQPEVQFIPEEKPVVRAVPEEKPIFQPVPEEKPTAMFEKMEQPVVLPVMEQKPVTGVVVEEKPVKKEKQATPVTRPVKAVQTPAAHKPIRKIEKPVEQSSQKQGVSSADLARAREAVARGDLIAALRRYIKLVNANKSLDHVSSDLKDLVRKNPKNYLAWQTYGDARLHSNKIQEALDAYAKAADLLK